MPVTVPEELLLDRVVRSGMLTATDIASARGSPGEVVPAPRWGSTVDILIQQGIVSENQIHDLAAQWLAEQSPPSNPPRINPRLRQDRCESTLCLLARLRVYAPRSQYPRTLTHRCCPRDAGWP